MKNTINPEYLHAFQNGSLREKYMRKLPYEHIVLPDFFTDSFIEGAREYCKTIALEPSPSVGEARYCTMGWGAFGDRKSLTEIYDRSFQMVMGALLDRPVAMSARAIPQYFKYDSCSRGMTIHNDDKEANGRQIVSLLQLSQGYKEGLGGELLLHEGKERNFSVARTIPPISNTFTIFLVSENSWHSVSDMKGDWIRELVAFDWYFK